MPDQTLHSTTVHLGRPLALGRCSRRLLRTILWYGCGFGLILVITSARSLAQQPYPNTSPSGNPPWTGRPPERVAQNPASPEIIRPGASTVQGTQPPGVPPMAVPPPPETTRPYQGIASPFDPTQYRLPTLGLPLGVGTPEPTPEIKKEYGQFVEREINPENTIQVVVGRAKVIVLRERPRRIYAPDETVAGFQVVTDQEFAVVGKKPGRTVLNLWFPDPRDPNDPQKDRTLSYLVVVLPDIERAELDMLAERKRLEGEVRAFETALKVLEREIKEAFPDSAVQLSLVGEQVVVRGEAKDVVDAAQILRIVAEHSPTARRSKVAPTNVNATFVPSLIPGRNVSAVFSPAPGEEYGPGNAIRDLVQGTAGGGINVPLIPGWGDEQAAVEAIRAILQGSPNMVNLLHVPGEQQVMLMVSVAEVNRDAARSVGINFSISKGAAMVGQFTGGLISSFAGNPAALANLPVSIDNGQVLLAIEALRTLDLARSLAEPNLTTMNGRPATFHAGGSFPVPSSVVLPGGAAQSVTYMPFGVDLRFTPYITDRNRVRLEISAEVSTRSTDTTQVSGGSVPSNLDTRRFNTTVELREGQTLAVAGLIQNNFGTTSQRVPFWGDLPILGRAGGLDKVTSAEQELVILVTPVLVHPLDMCNAPALPGNDIFEPGDVEFYLLGHLEGRRTEDYRASVRTDFCRQKRYCDCNDLYIIGPHGTTYACCKSGNCPCPCPRPAAGNPPDEPIAPTPEIIPPPAH